MPHRVKKGTPKNPLKEIVKDHLDIHHYYMDIINCMPGIVYWVDLNCNLKGCNNHFIELLGLKRIQDFAGTPYEQMEKFTTWSKERIQAFKLDDMAVLFSGESKYNIEEAPVYNTPDEPTYYSATRVPLFDDNKHVTDLVVVLTDMTPFKQAEKSLIALQPEEKKEAVDHSIEPNVLMVEDNLVAQKVEEALLMDLHCKVDIAESGDKALELFGPGKYDLVFMDIGLQDTSGYMVAKKFRQMEEHTVHHVPIIALTSYQADVVQHDCNEYFMDGVLSKPMTTEQAKQIIQHYIYHEDVPVDGIKGNV